VSELSQNSFKNSGRENEMSSLWRIHVYSHSAKDNARVVVTKAGADKIDEEWSIVAGTHDIFVAEKEEFAKEKEILRKRFGGKEPSDKMSGGAY